MVRELLSFLLVLVPAAYMWWRGREVVRRIDDPAFPELRFARAQWLVIVTAACVAVSLMLSFQLAVLKPLLTVVALVVADYPARRRIYNESWSLGGYLSHVLRLWIAFLGPWLLLAAIPWMIPEGRPAALPAAILLSLTALAWIRWNPRVVVRVLAARPLVDADLEPLFARVLESARCKRPQLFRVGPRGGYWVNALALPDSRRPGVIFTGDLLEALTPAETVAIFAHEVAHLEYFAARRVRRRIAFALLAVLLMAGAVGYGIYPERVTLFALLWALVVIAALIAMLAGSQAREHQADIRAVELTGDPESAISALTKIHALMKMPRRWRAAAENRVSHPSLARRVRAIREAAGLSDEPPSPATWEDVPFRSADDPESAMILSADRIHWLRGVPAEVEPATGVLLSEAREARSLRYAELADLRLEIDGFSGRLLVASDGQGKKMKLRLRPADVPRAKAALERVDLSVKGTSPAGARQDAAEAGFRQRGRLASTAMALLALLVPVSFPLFVTAVLAAWKPLRANLAVVGAIGVGAALLGWRAGLPYYGGGRSYLVVLLLEGVFGLLLLALAVMRQRKKLAEPRRAWRVAAWALGALGIYYGLAGWIRLTAPLPATQVHLWARHEPGLALVALGCAALLIASGNRRVRVPALAAFVIAGALAAIGSSAFGVRFGDDPLAVTVDRRPTTKSAPALEREIKVDGRVMELRVSPSGRRLALITASSATDEYGYSPSSGFRVEKGDGALDEIDALDLAFVDDERVAVLVDGDDGALLLRRLRIDRDWRLEQEILLTNVVAPSLHIDAAGAWQVMGADEEARSVTVQAGSFGDPGVRRLVRGFEGTGNGYLTRMVADAADEALAVEMRYAGGGEYGLASLFYPFSYLSVASVMWVTNDAGSRELASTLQTVSCVDTHAARADFICISTGREPLSTVWSIDPGSERFDPIAVLDGHYYEAELSGANRLLLKGYADRPALVDLLSRRVQLIDQPAAATDSAAATDGTIGWIAGLLVGGYARAPAYSAMAIEGDWLALARPEADSSTVGLYRLGG